MKISDPYFDFSKSRVNLEALLRLVKSFSGYEKREFRKVTGKGKGVLGYIKLFNCLNELAKKVHVFFLLSAKHVSLKCQLIAELRFWRAALKVS